MNIKRNRVFRDYANQTSVLRILIIIHMPIALAAPKSFSVHKSIFMNLADLETFVVVAEAKSVIMAAAKQKLSQSAVTRRLQSLESALGKILIHREVRPLSLTPEGTEAYKHAKSILSSAKDLRGALESDSEMTGEFRIGVSISLEDEILGNPIECLRRDFPKLQLRVVTAESSRLLRRVQKRELDAVLVLLIEGKHTSESLVSELLGTEALYVVASKNLKIRDNPSLEDLFEYPWALNPEGCNARDELRYAHNRLHLPFRIAMESSSAELKFALIEKGLGLGLSREANVYTSRYADRLRLILPRDFKRTVAVWFAYTPTIGRLKEPVRCLRTALHKPSHL